MARYPKTLRGMVHRAIYGVRSGRSSASMTPEQAAEIAAAVGSARSAVSRALTALLLTHLNATEARALAALLVAFADDAEGG